MVSFWKGLLHIFVGPDTWGPYYDNFVCNMKVSLTQSLLSTKTFFGSRQNTSQETWLETDRRKATLWTTWSQWTGNVSVVLLFRHLLTLDLPMRIRRREKLFMPLTYIYGICMYETSFIVVANNSIFYAQSIALINGNLKLQFCP